MMKKAFRIAAMAALVLTGCSRELQVKTADKLTVEYGDPLDNSKLYDAKESDENITVDEIQNYDAKKLGNQTLKVTFTDGDKTIQKDVKIMIKDTKKPEITLKKDKITITAGDKLDLKKNVKSVKDPVDGDLKYSDKEIKRSGYFISKGKLNEKKAGTYEVSIKAFDVNGNAAEKTFKVVVKKKEVKKAVETPVHESTYQQPQSTPPSTNNQVTGNNGGSSTSGSSNDVKPSSPSNNTSNVLCPGGVYPEKACDVVISHPSVPRVSSDGKVYDTHDEAWDAGMKQGMAGLIGGFTATTIDYNDGSQKWVWISYEDSGH